MTPRKRKATPSDSDYDSAPSRNKATRKTTSDTPAPQRAKRSLPPWGEETSSYVAKTVADAPEFTMLQLRPCQSYNEKLPRPWNVKVSEKCVTCIERQSALGTCRFVGLRAFKMSTNGIVDTTDCAFGFKPIEVAPKSVKKAPKKAPKKARKSQPETIPTRRSQRSNVVENNKDPVTAVQDDPSGITPDMGNVENTQANTSSKEQQVEGGNTLSDEMDKKTDTSPLDRPTLISDEMGEKEADYVLPLIAPVFAEHLRREKRHELTHLGLPTEGEPLPGGVQPIFRIPASPNTRSLCDICATSIFMGGYICGCCGKEMCLGCWEEWEPSDITERGRIRRIDSCSRRRRHVRDSMLFMTRAAEGEIAGLLERVEARVPSKEKQIQEQDNAGTETESIPTCLSTWPNEELKYLATPKTHYKDITLQQFRSLWRRGGTPLILTGFLDRFKLPWDPKYFTNHYGSEHCFIHDCEAGQMKRTNVADFFSDFTNPNIGRSHKLKDWPPSEDFSKTFPELFEDFEKAIPFPAYISRTGNLNLAAHFPSHYIAPDLGPKMYNAFPAPDFLLPQNSKMEHRPVKGTTNLHLDLTDAVNIMLFAAAGENAPAAATEPKDIPFCGAIWDIFPPSASTHIREYLNSEPYINAHKHEGAFMLDDPIHRQLYYLTEDDLITLYKTKGVMSHRIYQEPGEAVFIPAGCAHQVRNRRSCIKVAVDFLTPENVKVCKGLIDEARVMGDPFQGRRGAGKEDVLQLWSCLGFAWGAFDVPRKQETGSDGAGNVAHLTGSQDGVKGEGEGSVPKKEEAANNDDGEVIKVKAEEKGSGIAEQAARIEVETSSAASEEDMREAKD